MSTLEDRVVPIDEAKRSRRSGGRPPKYDWDALLDGSARNLRPGFEFTCHVDSMVNLFSRRARAVGKSARWTLLDDGSVTIWAEDPVEVPARRREASPSAAEAPSVGDDPHRDPAGTGGDPRATGGAPAEDPIEATMAEIRATYVETDEPDGDGDLVDADTWID